MFNFIKKNIAAFFKKNTFDEQALKELEQLCIEADMGASMSSALITTLKKEHITDATQFKKLVHTELEKILTQKAYIPSDEIFLLVGVNGSGKTTTAGKLAYYYHNLGKKVLLVAGDTFRAAASEQLALWANRTSSDIVVGKPGQDPAAVIFTACQEFKKNNYDILIIDTAGRLQTKINLMKELEKIKKVISQQLPNKKISTLLTVDSILGQNSLEQAKIFHESTHLDGIVLTKMDSSSKGGIVFAITHTLHIPIAYISYGEQPQELELFDAHAFVNKLLA